MSRLIRFLRKPLPDKIKSLRFHVETAVNRIVVVVPVSIRLDRRSPRRFLVCQNIGRVNRSGFIEAWYENLGELRFVFGYLKPGMVFADIGAYHGTYSLVAARRVEFNGRVVAFEPSLRDFRRLKVNRWLNRLGNMRVERAAVTAETGLRAFYFVKSGQETMSGLKPPPSYCDFEEVSVKTISLDAYWKREGLDRLDLMKIDTEGAEIEVLRGSSQVIGSFRPLIVCEVLDWFAEAWGRPANAIIDLLESWDYVWHDVLITGHLRVHQRRDHYGQVRNYLAVPREKMPQILSFLTNQRLSTSEHAPV